MLYNIHEDVIEKNLKDMKYLLGDSGVGRGQIQLCTVSVREIVCVGVGECEYTNRELRLWWSSVLVPDGAGRVFSHGGQWPAV